MNEMIERVAVAMWDAGIAPIETGEQAERLARVAVQAMREPTDAMVALGARHLEEDAKFWTVRMQALNVWTVAIDEALK